MTEATQATEAMSTQAMSTEAMSTAAAPVFTRHHGRTVTIRDPMRRIVLPEPYSLREKAT